MDKKCSNLKEILFQRIPGDLVSELWKRHGTWKRWILFQALPTVQQSPFYCQEYIFRIRNNSGMAFYWPDGKYYDRFIWQKEKVVKKRVPCILIWVRMEEVLMSTVGARCGYESFSIVLLCICVFVFQFSHFCLKREEMGGWMDEGFSISNFCAIITQAD